MWAAWQFLSPLEEGARHGGRSRRRATRGAGKGPATITAAATINTPATATATATATGAATVVATATAVAPVISERSKAREAFTAVPAGEGPGGPDHLSWRMGAEALGRWPAPCLGEQRPYTAAVGSHRMVGPSAKPAGAEAPRSTGRPGTRASVRRATQRQCPEAW